MFSRSGLYIAPTKPDQYDHTQFRNVGWLDSAQGIMHVTDLAGNEVQLPFANAVAITYSALAALAIAGTMVTGRCYLITDFNSIYIQSKTSTVKTGANPFQLLVIATSTTTTANRAYALPNATFPNADQWVIHYDLNIPQNIPVVSGILWASVTSGQYINIRQLLNDDFGYDLTGYTDAATKTFIQTTFASDNTGGDVPAAEVMVLMQYDSDYAPDTLPGTYTPTSSIVSKYDWADTTSKGVIWYMKDEFNNEAGYDFKNVLFRRYAATGYSNAQQTWMNGLYTEYDPFGGHTVSGTHIDMYTFDRGSGVDNSKNDNSSYQCEGNSVGNYFTTGDLVPVVRTLPNSVWAGSFQLSNKVGDASKYNTFLGNQIQNLLYFVRFSVIAGGAQNNTVQTMDSVYVYTNMTSNLINSINFQSNVIGDSFQGNVIGGASFSNSTFGPGFIQNVVTGGIENCTTGNGFSYNQVQALIQGTTFGDGCSYNHFIGQAGLGGVNVIGASFQNNIVKGEFSLNTIGHDFKFNDIGENFSNNTVGDNSWGNRFGFNCTSNVIGNSFIGNVCEGINSCTFGDSVHNNVFELNVQSLTAPSSSGTPFRNNRVRSGVTTINFTSATHVFAVYNTDIMINASSVNKLVYLDGSGVFQVVAPTA